jgi:cytochrome c biogenesis protein ResB
VIMRVPGLAARAFRLVASLRLTVFLLLLLCLLLIAGTVLQATDGAYEAQIRIFDSWGFLLFGTIPLPGMALAGALLFVNLLAAGARSFRPSLKLSGIILVHAGIAALIVNAAVSRVCRVDAVLTLEHHAPPTAAAVIMGGGNDGRMMTLPFSIALDTFVIVRHPGTDAPRNFESRVHISGDGIDRNAVVSMNKPFRHKKFTFYQASYSLEDGRAASTITVVRNPLKNASFWICVVMVAGILLHGAILFFDRRDSSRA